MFCSLNNIGDLLLQVIKARQEAFFVKMEMPVGKIGRSGKRFSLQSFFNFKGEVRGWEKGEKFFYFFARWWNGKKKCGFFWRRAVQIFPCRPRYAGDIFLKAAPTKTGNCRAWDFNESTVVAQGSGRAKNTAAPFSEFGGRLNSIGPFNIFLLAAVMGEKREENDENREV